MVRRGEIEQKRLLLLKKINSSLDEALRRAFEGVAGISGYPMCDIYLLDGDDRLRPEVMFHRMFKGKGDREAQRDCR